MRFAATTDWDIDQAVLLACQEELMEEAAYGLADRTPERSARSGWGRWQRLALIGSVGALVIAAIVDWRATLVIALLVVNLLFLVRHRLQARRVRRRDAPAPARWSGGTTLGSARYPSAWCRGIPDNELPVVHDPRARLPRGEHRHARSSIT